MTLKQARLRIFTSLYCAAFTTMIGIGIVVPFLPGYAANLGATGLWIGLTFSSFAISRALFMPIFGRLSDKQGRRLLIIAGLFLYTVLSFLYITASSIEILICIRFMHGMTHAMIFPVAMAYISDISPQGKEGRCMGSFTSSLALGLGLGPLIGGVLVEQYSIHATFLAMSFLSGIALIICLFILPDQRSTLAREPAMLSVILHPDLRGPLLFQFTDSFASGTFMVFLPVIAAGLGLVTAEETGMIISVSLLSTALFQRLFGTLADRYNKYSLIILGSLTIGIALTLVPLFHGFYTFLFSAFLIGIGGGISVPAMYALVTITGREVGQGSAMGSVNMMLSMGMIVAPLISGWIMDTFSIQAVFFISALIVISTIPVFLYLGRQIRSPSPA